MLRQFFCDIRACVQRNGVYSKNFNTGRMSGLLLPLSCVNHDGKSWVDAGNRYRSGGYAWPAARRVRKRIAYTQGTASLNVSYRRLAFVAGTESLIRSVGKSSAGITALTNLVHIQ